MKRVFLIGRCTRKSKAVWLFNQTTAPIAGPFQLCGMVSLR
jgi:hypothetical protein